MKLKDKIKTCPCCKSKFNQSKIKTNDLVRENGIEAYSTVESSRTSSRYVQRQIKFILKHSSLTKLEVGND